MYLFICIILFYSSWYYIIVHGILPFILYIVYCIIVYHIFYILYYILHIIYYILHTIYIYYILYVYILYIYIIYILYYIILWYVLLYNYHPEMFGQAAGWGFFPGPSCGQFCAHFRTIGGLKSQPFMGKTMGKPWENMGKPEKRWRNLWGNHGKRWGKVGKMPRSWEIYSKKNSNLRGNLRNIGKMAQPENFLVNNLIEMPKSWKPEKYGEHIIELASWKHTFRFLSFWRLFYVHIGNALWKSHP